MGKVKKTGVCEKCYIWGPFLARNLCNKCYYREWADERGYSARGVKGTNCRKCDKSLVNDPYSYNTMCKKCYENSRNLNKQCESCLSIFPRGSSYKLCKICRDKQRGVGSSKLIKDIYIDQGIKTSIKILLIKFKTGLWGPIDCYRVCHLYLTLFEYEVNMEVMDEVSQVKTMLKKMKELL
jgi:hypothetical protein